MSFEAFPACRFYVEIGGSTQAVFTEVGGIHLEMQTQPLQEGGQNGFTHYLPGPTKVSTVTLKRGIARTDELAAWYLGNLPGEFQRQNVTITAFSREGEPLRRWTFYNAYPIKWLGPGFESASNQIAIEALELAHEGMSVG